MNMKLRRLEVKDASLMLEWMQDESITENLQGEFEKKTLNDCKYFIQNSWTDKSNLHLAIVDTGDTYMGTVSLKHIKNGSAEFAITIRKSAMGRGFSHYGMKEIIRIGRKDFGICQVYWCVNPQNHRAVRFYEKNGYQKIDAMELEISGAYSEDQIKNYYWYIYKCHEFEDLGISASNCDI